MKKSIFFKTAAFTLFVSSCFASSVFANVSDDAFKFTVTQVGVHTEGQVNREGMDVNGSHIRFGFGNASVSNTLDSFRKQEMVPDFVFECTFRFSVAPFLVKQRAEDKVIDRLHEKVALYKEQTFMQMQPLVVSKVDATLKSTPGFASLGAPVQEQIRNKAIQSGMVALQQEIDKQANPIQAQKEIDLRHRIDVIKEETMYQEFAFGFSKVVGEGRAIVYVKGGKYLIDTATNHDINNETDLDRLRPVNSAVLNQVASTLAVGAGSIIRVDESTTLQTDVYVFHDRLPFLSGEDFVANTASMSDSDFERHQKWAKIDSALFRVLISKEFREKFIRRLDVYASAGSFDKNFGGQAGVVWRIDEKNEIRIDTSHNDSSLKRTKEAYDVFYTHDILPQLKAYTGYENLKGICRANISSQCGNESNVIVGMWWEIFKHTGELFSMSVRSSAEGNFNVNKNPNRKLAEFIGSLTLNAQWK